MASWSEFEAAAPDLAARVRARLDAHTHKTLATLRRDGSPRISGSETNLMEGELWIGSMWQALKARDLQRDPRFALHSGSEEPADWSGDAKLAGIAEEITDPERVQGDQRRGGSGRALPPVPAGPARGVDRRPRRGAQGPRNRGLDARGRRPDDEAVKR